MYVTGGAFTPAPHWNVQSTLPDRASYALKRPLPSPANTRSPRHQAAESLQERTRTNDAGTMSSVAKTLSDEDIVNLAHYLASL